MDNPFHNIFKSCLDEHKKQMEKLRDPNEIIGRVNRESRPSSDKTPVFHENGLAVLGRDGFSEALRRKIDENEDEAEETRSSAAKAKANGGMKKKAGKNCRETSSDKTSSLEALEEMIDEVEKNCRERRRRPIPGKPSSSSQNKGLKMADGKLSVLGMGGIGETTIHNNGATINFTFGTIQMTNHHYYKQEMDEMTMQMNSETVLFFFNYPL